MKREAESLRTTPAELAAELAATTLDRKVRDAAGHWFRVAGFVEGLKRGGEASPHEIGMYVLDIIRAEERER